MLIHICDIMRLSAHKWVRGATDPSRESAARGVYESPHYSHAMSRYYEIINVSVCIAGITLVGELTRASAHFIKCEEIPVCSPVIRYTHVIITRTLTLFNPQNSVPVARRCENTVVYAHLTASALIHAL